MEERRLLKQKLEKALLLCPWRKFGYIHRINYNVYKCILPHLLNPFYDLIGILLPLLCVPFSNGFIQRPTRCLCSGLVIFLLMAVKASCIYFSSQFVLSVLKDSAET